MWEKTLFKWERKYAFFSFNDTLELNQAINQIDKTGTSVPAANRAPRSNKTFSTHQETLKIQALSNLAAPPRATN